MSKTERFVLILRELGINRAVWGGRRYGWMVPMGRGVIPKVYTTWARAWAARPAMDLSLGWKVVVLPMPDAPRVRMTRKTLVADKLPPQGLRLHEEVAP